MTWKNRLKSSHGCTLTCDDLRIVVNPDMIWLTRESKGGKNVILVTLDMHGKKDSAVQKRGIAAMKSMAREYVK